MCCGCDYGCVCLSCLGICWFPFPSQHPQPCVCLKYVQTVNVYRLVTSGTIEEKIMKIQMSKLAMSKAIVNSDNSTMFSMGTDRLLDLFTFEGRSQGPVRQNKTATHGGPKESLLDNIRHEEEYSSLSVDNFLSELQK